ncbi:MAG: hypothetical protein CL916_00725 [Deltaproteobacteria bacterium]|nr:hypothetical protein [Deltaproteobacteria bacterium]
MYKSDIIQNGQPCFGQWFGDIQFPDPRGFRPKGHIISRFIRPFREKRWQYLGLYTPDVFMGLALVHAGYVGNVFCYVFDRKRGVLWEQERLAPLGAGIRVDRALYSGVSSYHTENERVRIEARNGIRIVDVRLKDKNQDLDVRLELNDDPNPVQIVTPTRDSKFTFTHKGAALNTNGTIRLGNQRWNIHDERTALDFTFGFPAYHTVWQWLSAHGTTQAGKGFSINGVAPVFHDSFHENVLWIEGEPTVLPPLIFNFDAQNPHNEWMIKTEDGSTELSFQPEGMRRQNIDYRVIASRFVQPFGNLRGFCTDKHGFRHDIEDVCGVVEDHEARW